MIKKIPLKTTSESEWILLEGDELSLLYKEKGSFVENQDTEGLQIKKLMVYGVHEVAMAVEDCCKKLIIN